MGTLSLPPDSPVSHTLLARAGAPLERLQRPVVTFIRDDALLSAQQVAGIVATTRGISLEGALKPGHTTNLYLANWTEKVKEAISPIRMGVNELWNGDNTTIIVVNTGAHWAPGSFFGFDKEEQMISAYHEAVRCLALYMSCNANNTV